MRSLFNLGLIWLGKRLGQANVAQQLGLTVLRIVRDNNQKLAVRANTTLREGDILIVEGQPG